MTTRLRSMPESKSGRPDQRDAKTQLRALFHRIQVVATTTTCVEMLLNNGVPDPGEIVPCTVRNIVDELGLIGEAVEKIFLTLGWDPYGDDITKPDKREHAT